MLKLIQFGRAWGVPDGSPFVVKVEAYLRMQETEYEIRPGNPRKSPHGQLPVLIDGDTTVADSTEIVNYLRHNHGDQVDSWLSQEQWTDAFMVEKMVEEYLYFLLLYQRWLLPQNFKLVARDFFSGVPQPLKTFLPYIVRRLARQRVLKQGLGRRGDAEVERLAREALDALSAKLGPKPYFLGEQPCYLDASIWGFLTNILVPDFPQGIGEYAKTLSNLVEYEKNFRELYFPDFC